MERSAFCMEKTTPITSTSLDLSIAVPGSSSEKDASLKPIKLPNSLECGENWINIGFPNSSEEMDDVDSPKRARDEGGSDLDHPPRKKLRLSKEQSQLLEESFRQNHTLNPKSKEHLAERLKLRPRQVEVWFQNRRARSKLKQTEKECEYLKRWFGSLTEQNRKLQKEIEQLRAMKVGPPILFPAQRNEPSSAQCLTMCPKCQRISSNPAHVDKPNSSANVSA